MHAAIDIRAGRTEFRVHGLFPFTHQKELGNSQVHNFPRQFFFEIRPSPREVMRLDPQVPRRLSPMTLPLVGPQNKG